MKNYLFFALCCILFMGCHTSKRPVLYELSTEESPASLAVMKRQYPDASGVYLFYKHDISNDLKPDFHNNSPRWYFFESYHWREMVLEKAEVEVGADSPATHTVMDFALASYEEIREIDYLLTTPDGTTQRYHKSDLQKERISGDSTRYQVQLEFVPAGSIVEVTYEIERGDLYKRLPVSHDVPFRLPKPAVELAFAYTYPWSWDVQVKQIGLQKDLNLTEQEQVDTETKTFQYTATDVPAYQAQQFGPYLKEVSPYFHVQVNKMEIGNVIVYEGPEVWENVAQKYAQYASLPDGKSGAKIRETLERLEITSDQSREMKIAAILAHIEEDITVKQRGGFSTVLKKQEGNPFAVAAYARSLMEEAGISSSYLVAHSAKGGNFDTAFVSDEQLYHPVLLTEDWGEPVFLFPSMHNVPPGYIPSLFENQPALQYTDGDFEGFTTIAQTHASAFSDENNFEVFVNSDGDARVVAEMKLGHHSAYQLFQLANSDEGQEDQTILGLLPHNSDQVEALGYRIDAGAWKSPTVITAEYTLNDCIALDDDNVVIKSCGFFDAMHSDWASMILPRRLTSTSDAKVELNNQVTINYPAAWTLLTDVKDVAETVHGARFTRSVRTSAGYVNIDQKLAMQRQPVQPIAAASASSAIALPARATLAMLELSTSPMYTDYIGMHDVEVEPGGPWTIVVKTFDSIKEAEREASKYRTALADGGYDVSLLIDGDTIGEYRLVIGNFATRTGVEFAKESLGTDLPFDTWILSLKPQMTAVSGGLEPIKH